MANAHTLLAIAGNFIDIDRRGQPQARVWLRLVGAGPVAQQLPAYPGLRDALARHATGLVDWHALAALAADAAVADLEIAEPLRPERSPQRWPAGSGAATPADAAAPSGVLLDAPGADDAPVLGLFDTGLPFAHLGLRPGGGHHTRLAALWDQDPQPDFGSLGHVPQPQGYGAVLPGAAMDAALAAHAGQGEAAVHAACGHGSVHNRRSHGAHTLGLLAMGQPWVDGAVGLDDIRHAAALQAPVLGVQPPRAPLQSPSRAAMCGAMLDALLWMQAAANGRRLLVAMPYGSTLGPHDGSSLFEQALDALLAQAGSRLQVYLPTGNSYRMHLHAVLALDGSAAAPAPGVHDLCWRLPPASEAASFVELWLPPGLQAQFDLLAPDGSTVLTNVGAVSGVAVHATAGSNGVASGIGVWAPAPGGARQQCLLLRLAPSLVADSGRVAAASGDWRLRLHSLPAGATGTVHAYGARAQGSFGAALRGRQARLLVPAGSAWVVQPLGSINGIAGGQQAWVVGGYNAAAVRGNVRHMAWPAHYTAAGAGRNGRTVDTSLASEVSAALGGVRSTGTLSAVAWRMDGSSVAVPQAVRVHMGAGPGAASMPLAPLPPGPGQPDGRLGWPTVP